jgi:hypothetical protein
VSFLFSKTHPHTFVIAASNFSGYIPAGSALQNTQMIDLWVQSDLHDENEYGKEVRGVLKQDFFHWYYRG